MKASLILVFAGMAMLLFGLFLIFLPPQLIWTIGLAAAIFGIIMLVLGFVITARRSGA